MTAMLATRLSHLGARIRNRLRASTRPGHNPRPSTTGLPPFSERDLRLPMGTLVPVRVRHTTDRRTRG